MAVGTYTYVTQTATTLEILNRDTAATVGTISPGLANMAAVVVSPDGRYMCVTSNTGGNAVVIDLSTNTVVLTVTLAGAGAVQAIAGWFLITSASTSGVWVNTATMTQTAVTFSVSVDINVHLANGNAYYYGAGTIYQVANGGTSSTTFASGLQTFASNFAAFAHDATYLYVVGYRTSNTSDYLYAFTWAAVQSGPVLMSAAAFGSFGALAVVPSTGNVVGTAGGYVYVFNTPPMTGGLAVATSTLVSAGSAFGLVVHPTLPLAYVLDGSNHVIEFNVSLATSTSVVVTGSNRLAIGPSGAHLWTSGSSVYEVMTTSPIALSASYTPSALGPLAVSLAVFTAPSAPTLTSPVNASYADVSAGLAFASTYNGTDIYGQNAYAMRIKISGGSYQYWNAGSGALQGTIVWNTNAVAPGSATATLPNTVISNGNVYNWSMASQESGANLQGAFASDLTFTARAAPTVSITAPTGTVTGSTTPAVTWTESVAGGASQIDYQIKVESGAYGTTPGSGTSVWDSGVVGSASQAVTVGTSLTPGVSYRVFVQITETGGQVSTWAYSTFTLLVDVPATPTITAVATTNGTTGLPEIDLSVQGHDNQLSAVQSSCEGGLTTGWAAGANTTIAASATWSMDGSYSLRMTATGAGAVSAATPTGTGGMVCLPGQTVRAMAWLHSPTTPRACTVAIGFYNAAGSLISTSTSASVNSTTTGGATGAQAFLTATAPAGAAFAALIVNGAALGAGEVLYADQLLFAPGTSTTWSVGGFIGVSTITILRSDGAYVRNAGWPVNTSLIVPAVAQAASTVDVEISPGVAMTYSAVVVAGTVSSVAAVSSPVILSPLNWDIMDPLNPSAGTAIQWAGDSRTFGRDEVQGVFSTLGRASSVVVRGDLHSQSFDLSLNFGGDADAAWQAFDALRSRQVTVMLRGDMQGDLYYVALGSARPSVTYRTGDRVNNPSRSLVIHCNPVDRP